MATNDSFRYTNSKLDTVEAGIEVVKAKVGLVDEKVGAMAEDWKTYGSKIHELEDNIHYHDTKMDEFRTREEIHSAKLRNFEEELSKLRAQNNRLQDDLWTMHKSPRFNEDGRDRAKYYSPNDKNDTDKRNVDFQRDHLTHRETYREQMHGPEMVRKPYNSQDKLLERERQLEAQIRREMEKIELHDGNFKPWARDAKNPTHHVPKSTNSGVYLFIRTNKLAKADVVKALQEGRSVLANSYGQLKGIATNREIQLLEGQEGWNIRANMTRTGDYWLERSQDSTVIDDMILVIWFPTFNDAEKWVISERKFKTPSFPEPYGSDVMILPLNDSQPQERIAYTYITTEYPRQLDPVMFRENFVPKIKEVLYKHGNDGFFIQSVGAKVIRGHWVKPSSLITTIRFNTRQDALNFFLDPEYKQIRQEISRRIEQLPVYMNWFKPVSFMFTLDKYV